MYDQLPYTPKNLKVLKDDKDDYQYQFDGFVYWDDSEEDFFISEEDNRNEELIATIALKLSLHHSLAWMHYFGNRRKRKNNN